MSEFDRRKNTPQYWYNKASDLRASAGAIWYCMLAPDKAEIALGLGLGEGFDISVASHSVFPMLCGLALELQFKAICVKRGITVPKIHNLLTLAENVWIDLPPELIPFVNIFAQSIMWAGKYPVPNEKQRDALGDLNKLRKDTLFKEVGLGNGTIRFYQSNGKLSWETFNTVWKLGHERYFDMEEPDETSS